MTLCLPINGARALICVDTGATVNALSPDFVKVTKTSTFTLDHPVGLQLACKGSKTKLTTGTYVPIRLGSFSDNLYHDVVNIDRYDAIWGIPALRDMKACIDLGENTIVLGGQLLHGLSSDEEAA
ncbi:hypothetical protein DL93DRAFT_2069153, partial [Clavulina sp. PMI_390]